MLISSNSPACSSQYPIAAGPPTGRAAAGCFGRQRTGGGGRTPQASGCQAQGLFKGRPARPTAYGSRPANAPAQQSSPQAVTGCTLRIRPCGGSSPERRQSVRRHLEFRGAFLDGGGLVRGLYIAKPDGIGGNLVDGPPDRPSAIPVTRPCPQYRPARWWIQQCTNRAKVLFGQLRRH
jgi:hypothetical protein